MDIKTTKDTLAGFVIPTVEDQLKNYFSQGGNAAAASASLGLVFHGDSDGLMIAKTIDGSFLK